MAIWFLGQACANLTWSNSKDYKKPQVNVYILLRSALKITLCSEFSLKIGEYLLLLICKIVLLLVLCS